MKNPSISIVLPVWNGAADLRALMPVLRAQNYGGEVEIVAIDSASRDDSVAQLERYGVKVHHIAQTDFSHGATRNLGVQLARGEIVVFLSQDALPRGENWLSALAAPLENPRIGATFARQLPRPAATPFERHLHRYLYPPQNRVSRAKPGAKPTWRQNFFSNVCSAARRETCLRFPFDETAIMSEDQFFARDLLQAELEIFYNARCEVVHSHHYDLPALFRRNFDSGYSLRALGGDKAYRRIATALRFWSSAAFFTAREAHLGWLFYLPLYELTRALALLSGAHAERLPRAWRRALSLHRHFWHEKP